MNSISIALSGMIASMARLNAAASNVANARTEGRVPATPPSQPVPPAQDGEPQVYQAVDVAQTSVEGGTLAGERLVLPSYVKQYDPSARFADAQGMIAAPNVDLTREVLNEVEAVNAYKANAKVMKAADEMAKSLLDATA